MLDNTSRYVYEVYRLKSVSLAAQKLYISQPSLSSAIRKAEERLGAPIFNRKTHPFTLTDEGKVYIDAIEKVLALEARTEDRIRDIRQERSGTLRIATSTHISYWVLPKILKAFHSDYPQVDIHIQGTESDKIYGLLEKGLADLILMPVETVPDGYAAVPLFEQKMTVVLPMHVPISPQLDACTITREALLGGSYDSEKEICDLSLFEGIDFIYTPPNTNIYKKRSLLFGKSGIAPYITTSTGNQMLNFNLMLAGFGALFTTDANIATMPPQLHFRCFVLGGPEARQQFSIVSPHGHVHNSVLSQAFIQTAITIFEGDNPLNKLVSG